MPAKPVLIRMACCAWRSSQARPCFSCARCLRDASCYERHSLYPQACLQLGYLPGPPSVQRAEAASCSTLEQMGPEVLQFEARLAQWLKHRRPWLAICFSWVAICFLIFPTKNTRETLFLAPSPAPCVCHLPLSAAHGLGMGLLVGSPGARRHGAAGRGHQQPAAAGRQMA